MAGRRLGLPRLRLILGLGRPHGTTGLEGVDVPFRELDRLEQAGAVGLLVGVTGVVGLLGEPDRRGLHGVGRGPERQGLVDGRHVARLLGRREASGCDVGELAQLAREVPRVLDDPVALRPDPVGVDVEILEAALRVGDDSRGLPTRDLEAILGLTP